MRIRRAGQLGVVALLVLLFVVAAVAPAAAQGTRTAVEDQVAAALVQFINAERQARGLSPLSRAADESYAQQRALEQPEGGNDGHAGFSSEAAAAALGLGVTRSGGEALFYGSAHTAGDAVLGWMGSDSHRDLLMNSAMTLVAIGVSCRDGAMHAVAHAGAPTRSTLPPTPTRPVVSTSSGPTCEGSEDPSASPGASEPPVTIPLDPEPGPAGGFRDPAVDDGSAGGTLLKTLLVLGLAALVGWIVWNRVMSLLRPEGTAAVEGDEGDEVE